MPKFTGQTDSPLQIKLKSEIVEARWGTSQVAQGGRVQIEVTTAFVADGATLKITLKDKEGAAVDTVVGKIYANLYRGFYVLSKPNKTGAMTFEAELPDHAAKGKAGWIKVLPPIKITELKLQDGEGKDLQEIAQEPILKMVGKVEGPPDGTHCDFVLFCRIKDQAPQPVFTGKGILTAGQVSCQWKRKSPQQEPRLQIQPDLDKLGEKYETPIYHFELSCLGASATSTETKYVSWVEIRFRDLRGKATLLLPDGRELVEQIPDDGILKLEKPLAGSITVKSIEPPADKTGK
jgi:hypothetical protein